MAVSCAHPLTVEHIKHAQDAHKGRERIFSLIVHGLHRHPTRTQNIKPHSAAMPCLCPAGSRGCWREFNHVIGARLPSKYVITDKGRGNGNGTSCACLPCGSVNECSDRLHEASIIRALTSQASAVIAAPMQGLMCDNGTCVLPAGGCHRRCHHCSACI